MGGALYRAGPNRRGESFRDDVENIILRSEMKILRRKSALSHADYFSPMPWRRIAFDERDLLRMQRRLGAPPGSSRWWLHNQDRLPATSKRMVHGAGQRK